MTGRVSSIQTLGALDGPGIRVVAFLSGCPLRCEYCHNPETWDYGGGAKMSAEALLDRIRRSKPYFGARGGATLSGGEPLAQAEFAAEVFALCRAEGVRTALDTAGTDCGADAGRLLDNTDLCLLDVKSCDSGEYRRLTGGDLSDALAFLRELDRRGVPTRLRQVVARGLNDAPESAEALKSLAAAHGNVIGVDFLPFRNICARKYDLLGIPFPMRGVEDYRFDCG